MVRKRSGLGMRQADVLILFKGDVEAGRGTADIRVEGTDDVMGIVLLRP